MKQRLRVAMENNIVADLARWFAEFAGWLYHRTLCMLGFHQWKTVHDVVWD